MKTDQIPRRSRSILLTLGLLFVTSVVFGFASSASAASYEYASEQPSGDGVAISTSSSTSIKGGTARAGVGVGQVSIVTYIPAPGYHEYWVSTVANPYVANSSHPAYTALSKCFWFAGGLSGKIDLTCTYRY